MTSWTGVGKYGCGQEGASRHSRESQHDIRTQITGLRRRLRLSQAHQLSAVSTSFDSVFFFFVPQSSDIRMDVSLACFRVHNNLIWANTNTAQTQTKDSLDFFPSSIYWTTSMSYHGNAHFDTFDTCLESVRVGVVQFSTD